MKTKIQSLWLASCVFTSALAPQIGAADESSSTYSGSEKTFTGIVTAVDLNQHTLKVHGALFFGKTFNLGGACSYSFLEGASSMPVGLHPGQKISVVYQGVDGVLVADHIVQQPMRFTGYVKAVDLNAHTVSVQPGGFGTTRQFHYPEGCQVTLLGDRQGTLAEIQPGNHVTLTYETPPGMATVNRILQTSEKFTGALTAIDLEAKTLKAKSLLDDRSFNVGDHCVVDLDGKGGGRLGELRPEEKLVFTFDNINGVNVVNRIEPAKDGGDSVSASNRPASY